MMNTEQRRKRDREVLTVEVDKFLDAVYATEPRLDEGEEHKLILRAGAYGGTDDDGELIISFTARHELETTL